MASTVEGFLAIYGAESQDSRAVDNARHHIEPTLPDWAKQKRPRKFDSSLAGVPMISFLSIFVSLSLISPIANPLAEIEFSAEVGAQGTQLMHAAGPEELANLGTNKKHRLKRVGTPEFVPQQPELFATKGAGCLEFDGDGELYVLDRGLIPESRRFVLESWAVATNANHVGLHVVVGHGDGGRGFLIAQQNDQWVVFVGGVGAVPIGAVVAGEWVHLAIIFENGELTVFQNGQQTQQRNVGWHGLAGNFSIGGIGGRQSEYFAGRIAAVRLSQFSVGEFDASRDLWLDYKKVREQNEQQAQEQQAYIANVLAIPGLELVDDLQQPKQASDWLVEPVQLPVRFLARPNAEGLSAQLALTNGLISRDFFVSGNLATVSIRNLSSGAQYVRSVQPEARINLDGTWYAVGGLKGQKLKAYLMNDWLSNLHDDSTGFKFVKMETGAPKLRYPWHPRFNSGEHAWPPTGRRVTMTYAAPESARPQHRGTLVHVHYEMYVGIPVLCKYLEFENTTSSPINVDQIETEIVALQQDQIKRIQMESDYSHALFNRESKASDTQHLTGSTIHEFMSQGSTTKWRIEPDYHFYATHNQHEDKLLDYPHHNVMVSTIPKGPDETVLPGKLFTSMHSFELLHDSDDSERKSLGYRRMYRVIAPQVNESLVSAFISSTDIRALRPYIDQCAELGFESLSLQWPGVRIAHDNLDPEYISQFKKIADYGKSKGIILGAYELVIASRDRGAENNVVHPITKRPGGFFGQSACCGSEWFEGYQKNTLQFLDQTGFGMWDIDGPYHGEPCASDQHPGHKGLDDSQWQQWKIFRDFLAELMRRDQYLPIPEWNFLTGQSVTSMGYREAAAGLPANLQLLLYRQYIYDGTWYKTPTMGWIEFDVGKLQPFDKNLKEYERWLIQGLGSGTRINWRGPGHFYDTAETKTLVKGWFDWFHRHREILTSDIIHLARPSGRDLDAIFHVNPSLEERGLVVVFNPLSEPVKQNISLPLYYTGISETASISVHTGAMDEGTATTYPLSRNYEVQVPIEVPAEGHVWLLIKDARGESLQSTR